MYELARLENGLMVATVHMPQMTSVSLGLWVAVGGRYEPLLLSGASHFIEHLLFKGTHKRSAREISEAVEGVGGYLNAFTSEEHSCFYAKAPCERFPDLLDVLVDMLLNSRFSPADINKERDVIKDEAAMYIDQPQQHVQELLNETQWPDHPLGRPLTGSEASLDAMRRRDLLKFHRTHYIAPACCFACAGNKPSRDVVAAVSRIARHFPQGERQQFLPVQWDQTRPVVRLFRKPIEQTQAAIGIRTCSRHDERRFALRVLNTMLGESMSSRLFQRVREDSGMAYSIYSTLSFFEDAGDLVISAGLETNNLPKVLKLIAREIYRLTRELVTAGELRRMRDYIAGQIDLSLESTESQMMWLGEQALGYRGVIPPAEAKKRLCAVKPADIRRVAQDFFRPDRINLALVSPLKKASHLAKLLQRP